MPLTMYNGGAVSIQYFKHLWKNMDSGLFVKFNLPSPRRQPKELIEDLPRNSYLHQWHMKFGLENIRAASSSPFLWRTKEWNGLYSVVSNWARKFNAFPRAMKAATDHWFLSQVCFGVPFLRNLTPTCSSTDFVWVLDCLQAYFKGKRPYWRECSLV